MLRNILTFIAVIIACQLTETKASEPVYRHSVDSLRQMLTHANTSADSVVTMCNLYDILPRTKNKELGDSIYHTAMRARNFSAALDMVRNLANRGMRNDSLLRVYMRWAKACPESDERRETETFIKLLANMCNARYGDPHQREEVLKKYLEQANSMEHKDLYDKIVLTHGLCLILGDDPNGELLQAYMDSLGVLIRQLPSSAYSIRNTYNVHRASIFAISHPEKSMIADLTTLSDIDKLEKYYQEHGRKFRNYDINYYLIYSRLLSNFAVLDSARVEEYYQKAMDIVNRNVDVKNSYDKTPAIDVYYAMYKKDYHKALPLIKKLLNQPVMQNRYLNLLRFEIEAAIAINDKETLLEALQEYSHALQNALEERTTSTFRELQTAYAIYDIKYNMGQEELRRRKSVAQLQKTVIIGSAIAIIVLLALVIILTRQYRKNRKLANDLKETNRQLVSESESLKQSRTELIRARDQAQKANNLKSDFIKNMSYEVKVPLQAINEYSHLIADCVSASAPDDGASRQTGKHLEQFANLLELNSELLSTIVNDVLRLSEIDNAALSIQAQVVNVQTLAQATLASVAHRVKKDVTLQLDPQCGKEDMFTDPTRLQQILNNLLTNAAKFTDEGSITLSYAPDKNGKNMVFTVTDTGIGINPENKEKIFDRFVKLDRDSQGAGLGLTISRMLARSMGGDLKLDTTYRDGARFILTLPRR